VGYGFKTGKKRRRICRGKKIFEVAGREAGETVPSTGRGWVGDTRVGRGNGCHMTKEVSGSEPVRTVTDGERAH